MISLPEFFGLVSLVIAVLGVAFLNDRSRGPSARREDGVGLDPARDLPRNRRRTPRLTWFIVGLFLGLILFFSRPDPAGSNLGLGIVVFLTVIAALVLVLALLSALHFLRPRDRVIEDARQRARAGDLEGALSILGRQIEVSGPSAARCDALGGLLMLKKDWQQAYIQFLDAERLDGRKGRYLAKQGIASWKMGRAEEALELLRRATELEPQDPSHGWNSCLILADLGRLDEARAHLRHAEDLVEMASTFGSPRRGAMQESIAACRRRLAEAFEEGAAGTHGLS